MMGYIINIFHFPLIKTKLELIDALGWLMPYLFALEFLELKNIQNCVVFVGHVKGRTPGKSAQTAMNRKADDFHNDLNETLDVQLI